MTTSEFPASFERPAKNPGSETDFASTVDHITHTTPAEAAIQAALGVTPAEVRASNKDLGYAPTPPAFQDIPRQIPRL